MPEDREGPSQPQEPIFSEESKLKAYDEGRMLRRPWGHRRKVSRQLHDFDGPPTNQTSQDEINRIRALLAEKKPITSIFGDTPENIEAEKRARRNAVNTPLTFQQSHYLISEAEEHGLVDSDVANRLRKGLKRPSIKQYLSEYAQDTVNTLKAFVGAVFDGINRKK